MQKDKKVPEKRVEKEKVKKEKVKKEWKELPSCQVSDSLLWETTKNYTSFLVKNNGLTLSCDPLNLTCKNTKKDSGIASFRAIGIDYDIENKDIKIKKKKEKRDVVRFNLKIKTKKLIPKKKCVELKENPETNHCVYSTSRNVPIRAIVKSMKRDLNNYRRDLVPTALRKLYVLYRFKKAHKYGGRKIEKHKHRKNKDKN